MLATHVGIETAASLGGFRFFQVLVGGVSQGRSPHEGLAPPFNRGENAISYKKDILSLFALLLQKQFLSSTLITNF